MEKDNSNSVIAIIVIVTIIVFLIGVGMIVSSSNKDEAGMNATNQPTNSNRDSANMSVDTHREDNFIGYSVDTLCYRRGQDLGDDKIYMGDDTDDDYLGAFIKCDTYFNYIKSNETLYVYKRVTFEDTRTVRKSFDEFEEEDFSYYVYMASDRNLVTSKGVTIRE